VAVLLAVVEQHAGGRNFGRSPTGRRSKKQAATKALEPLVRDYPGGPDFSELLALAYTGLGLLLEKHGQWTASESTARSPASNGRPHSAAEQSPEFPPATRPQLLRPGPLRLHNKDNAGAGKGDLDAAEQQEKIQNTRGGGRSTAPDLAKTYLDLGMLHGGWGGGEGRTLPPQKALQCWRSPGPPAPPGSAGANCLRDHAAELTAVLLAAERWEDAWRRWMSGAPPARLAKHGEGDARQPQRQLGLCVARVETLLRLGAATSRPARRGGTGAQMKQLTATQQDHLHAAALAARLPCAAQRPG